MKTPEQQKEYRHEYYEQHKEYHYQKFREWCKDNPIELKVIQKRWRDKHPHYYRDYMRNRKAVTEPRIFQFLDNGFSGDIDGYVSYLRAKGVSEKHIRWFRVDVQKHLRF